MNISLFTKISLAYKFFKFKKFIIAGFILFFFLLTLRLMAPYFILKQVNDNGKTMSYIYTLHAEDLSLSLLTGTVKLHEPALTLISAPEKFMKAKSLTLNFDLLKTLSGTVAFDEWIIEDWLLTVTPAVEKAYKNPKYKKTPTQTIAKISATNAKLVLNTLKKPLVIFPINGMFSNFGSSRFADFKFSSHSDMAHIDWDGQINPNVRPLDWDINLVLKDLKLKTLNELAGSQLPVVFKQGTLELFFEGVSHQKVLKGYVKPFIEDVVIESKDAKKIKTVAGGLAGSFIEWFMSDKKNKTLGLKIPFTLDHDKFSLEKSFKLNLEKPPKKGIEGLYRL